MAFKLTQPWDKLKTLPEQKTAESGPVYNNVKLFTNVAGYIKILASSFVTVVIKAYDKWYKTCFGLWHFLMSLFKGIVVILYCATALDIRKLHLKKKQSVPN